MLEINASSICRLIREFTLVAQAFRRHGYDFEAGQCEVFEGIQAHVALRLDAGARAMQRLRVNDRLRAEVLALLPGAEIAGTPREQARDFALPSAHGWSRASAPAGMAIAAIDMYGGAPRLTCVRQDAKTRLS